MKKNNMVAKVNKEIGGWDYRGFHISRNKNIKELEAQKIGGSYYGHAKTLGEIKDLIDKVIEKESSSNTACNNDTDAMHFTSKRGTEYLVQVVNGVIRAFTYEENGKKHYWTVTSEIRSFIAGLE